jgi:hypothetical protein
VRCFGSQKRRRLEVSRDGNDVLGRQPGGAAPPSIRPVLQSRTNEVCSCGSPCFENHGCKTSARAVEADARLVLRVIDGRRSAKMRGRGSRPSAFSTV